jgi:5-methylthioadenosine/S-adenosylhomocysteine deaminase
MTMTPHNNGLRIISERVLLQDENNNFAIAPASIDIANGVIQQVHVHGKEKPPLPHSNTEISFSNRLITPAFIDAHTHLALTALRGHQITDEADRNLVENFFFRIEAHFNANDVRAFVRMGAYEAMLNGTALVWDHYYYGDAVTQGLQDVGLSAVVAPTLQDLSGPGVHQLDAALETTIEIANSDLLKSKGIFAALGPHATDTVSTELFQKVASLASTHNLPVHCHIAQSVDELVRAFEHHDTSPLSYMTQTGVIDAAPRTLLVHGIFLNEEDISSLRNKPVTLACCPHSKMIFAFLPRLDLWIEASLDWILATDCAASNDAWNIQKELRFTAGLPGLSTTWSTAYENFLKSGSPEAGELLWSERQIQRAKLSQLENPGYLLDRVWRIPGEMHPELTAGKISEGAIANLVVWDTDHPAFWPDRQPLRSLVYSDTAHAIHNLMINGHWMGESGSFAQSILDSEAYKEARSEATGRLQALFKRL